MSVGPPGGRQCEVCGATRWDQKQVHGWIESARRERDEARAGRDRLYAALRKIEAGVNPGPGDEGLGPMQMAQLAHDALSSVDTNETNRSTEEQ